MNNFVSSLIWFITGFISLHFGLVAFGHNLLNVFGLHNPSLQMTVAAVAVAAGALSLLMLVGKLFGYSLK